MAVEIAPTSERTQVFKLQPSGPGFGTYDRNIEVYEVRVVRIIALYVADAVGIVAGRTRDLFIKMLAVPCETLIREDAVATVALIAQFV
jgi:hypothetical protein